MGSSYYAIYTTTDNLERKVAEANIFPVGSEKREDALYEILWGTMSGPNCTHVCFRSKVCDFESSWEKAVTPESVSANVRLFLGALPPLNGWVTSEFKESGLIGRKNPVCEDYDDLSIWFLTEDNVRQLKDLSCFMAELDASCQEQELALSELPPIPRFFLARWIIEPKRDLESNKIYYLQEVISYIDMWIKIIDDAIRKKTGLLIFQT